MHGRAVRESQVLLIGIAFSPNVDDMREAPAAEIMERLVELVAEMNYSDPFVPSVPSMHRHSVELASVDSRRLHNSLSMPVIRIVKVPIIYSGHNMELSLTTNGVVVCQ